MEIEWNERKKIQQLLFSNHNTSRLPFSIYEFMWVNRILNKKTRDAIKTYQKSINKYHRLLMITLPCTPTAIQKRIKWTISNEDSQQLWDCFYLVWIVNHCQLQPLALLSLSHILNTVDFDIVPQCVKYVLVQWHFASTWHSFVLRLAFWLVFILWCTLQTWYVIVFCSTCVIFRIVLLQCSDLGLVASRMTVRTTNAMLRSELS